MKILYYFNCKENHRPSMYFYSNLLFNYRKTNKTFKFTKFTPKNSLFTKLLNNKKFYKLKQKQGLKRAKIFNRNYFHKEIIKTYKEELNKLIKRSKV